MFRSCRRCRADVEKARGSRLLGLRLAGALARTVGEEHQESAGDREVLEEHDHLRLIGEVVVEEDSRDDEGCTCQRGDAGLEADDQGKSEAISKIAAGQAATPGRPTDGMACGAGDVRYLAGLGRGRSCR